MNFERNTAFVLHSRQPLTRDVCEAFPAPSWDTVILTDGSSDRVYREDAEPASGSIIVASREKWAALVSRRVTTNRIEVATNDEYCLQICAELRAKLGLTVRLPSQLDRFRDKVVMKQVLAAAGIAVPRCLPLNASSSYDAVTAWTGGHFPVVVKPRAESNSRGVAVLRSVAELDQWWVGHPELDGWELEGFVDGSYHHVNALVTGSRIEHVFTGNYLGPLLDFDEGRRLGGASEPTGTDLDRQASALNRRVVRALSQDGDFVVHTEFVRNPDSGALTVLEVAARAPGALVSEVSRIVTGHQLETVNLRLQAGLPTKPENPLAKHAGWLWVPILAHERRAGSGDIAANPQSRRTIFAAANELGPRPAFALGGSLLLWSDSRDDLEARIAAAASERWFS